MKLLLRALFVFAAMVSNHSAGYYGVEDPTMGEYEGFWTAANGAKGRITAQVRPLSNNRYDGFILIFRSRSPVAGFTLPPAALDKDRIDFTAVALTNDRAGDLFARNEGACTIEKGKLTGTFKGELGEGKFEATKAERKSPTLGAKPPRSAIVLFDGKPSESWENFSWPLQDGIMQVGKGNIQTRDQLRDFRLHVEFRTPYMPSATGQARGNSGVYLQGKYEVQVLDSFGLYPLQNNDCSAIYSLQAPRANACLPPMEWQTYDITYHNDGPTITVSHNGMTVVEDFKVPQSVVDKGTTASSAIQGFLLLQDHGNPVQYRNIWAERLRR